ncbi:MAG: acyl-CoA dehydrogenase family protein, partial [Planctomycetota bacterium]
MSAQTRAQIKTPEATDYFDVRSLLTEDERMIQDVVARFVDERILPGIAQAFDEHRFPAELIPELAELGLLGCYFEGYDCAGLSNVCYGLICQELDRGDAGIRSFVSVQTSLCMYPIHTYGSEEQKQRWLPPMARGEAIGCFGLTEADGGSDPGANKTRAVRDGGDWVINGSKMWITNGTIADLAIVWANTDDGVRGFIVEKGTPGYTSRDIERTYSLRAMVTSELFFDDVRVPDENMLPHARGLGAPLSCLTQARFGIAWGA